MRAHGDHRPAAENRAAHEALDGPRRCLQAFFAHHVCFGQDRDAALNAKQGTDCQMFFGLRHDAFGGRDHHHHRIDAGGACQHVAHESRMSRHVDKAQTQRRAIRRLCFERGKTQINRDAAALLFGKAIRVDSRQRPHERGFAVVDVAGRAKNHGSSRRSD